MKTEFKHNGSFFKSFWLLVKALLASLSYGTLWLGIAFCNANWGVVCLVAGAVLTLLSLFVCVIIPLSRLK